MRVQPPRSMVPLTEANELARPVTLDPWPDQDAIDIAVHASDAECVALAERFGWLGLADVAAELRIERDGADLFVLTGRLKAQVTRKCVVTLEPVTERVEEAVHQRFERVAAWDVLPREREVDMAMEPDDVEPLVGPVLDVGEVVAESLALALDPYPRSVEADAVAREAGVVSEGDVGSAAFAELGRLKN